MSEKKKHLDDGKPYMFTAYCYFIVRAHDEDEAYEKAVDFVEANRYGLIARGLEIDWAAV